MSTEALRTPADFQVLAIVNPNSTRAGHVRQDVINPLLASEWGRHLIVLETRDPKEVDNIDLIRQNLAPNRIVLSNGGDGLAHLVTRAQITAEIPEDKRPPTMLLPFGNGNDGARATAGMNILRGNQLLDTLANGPVRKLGTLAVTNSEGQTIDGMGWVGVGATATVSEHLNNPTYRKIKKWTPLPGKLLDAVAIPWVATRNEPNKCQLPGEAPGLYQEHVWNNLPTMAKFVRIEINAFDDHMRYNIIGDQNPLGGLALRALDGLISPGGWGIRGQEVTKSAMELMHDTLIQIDGETYLAPAGSFTVKHQPQTLPVLTQASPSSFSLAA